MRGCGREEVEGEGWVMTIMMEILVMVVMIIIKIKIELISGQALSIEF